MSNEMKLPPTPCAVHDDDSSSKTPALDAPMSTAHAECALKLKEALEINEKMVAEMLAIELLLLEFDAPSNGELAERIAAVFNRFLQQLRELHTGSNPTSKARRSDPA